MPDVVGTGVIRIEVDESSAERDIDTFVNKQQAKINAKMKSTGDSSGKSFADAFSKQLDTRVNAALKAIPDVKIGADLTEAESKLQEIKTELVGLSKGNYLALGLTDSQALKQIDELRAELDLLTIPEHDIRIRVNAAEASAQLVALKTELEAVEDAGEKAGGGKSGRSSGTGILLTSILALGPALVPLGAVASAALGAIAVGAAAAVVGVLGINAEIKAGTLLGQQYSKGLQTLKTDLSILEQTAAQNFLAPFEQSVRDITKDFPQLNTMIAQFSTVVGKDAQLALHGLLSGFIQLQPLLLVIAADAQNLFTRFDKFSSGTGIQKFSEYVESELPHVEQVVSDLGSAVIKVIQGLEPLGSASLSSLGLVANIINALPVDALKIIIPLATAAFLAFKAYEGLNSVIKTVDALSISLKAAGASLVTAIPVAGALIVGLGLLASAFLGSGTSASSAAQATDDYTQALITSHGVVDSTIQQQAAQALATDANIKAAQDLGLTIDDLTQAALGNQTAVKKVGDALSGAYNSSSSKATGEALKLREAIDTQSGSLDAAKVKQAAYAQSVANTTAVAKSLADQIKDVDTTLGVSDDVGKKYAATLGYTADQYQSNEFNARAYSAAVQNTARLEDTANGATQSLLDALNTYSTSAGGAADNSKLLGAAFVALQGDALSYAGAQADAYAANAALIKGFDASEKSAIKFKTGLNGVMTASIDYKNAGAGPLISQLDAIQSAANLAGQATYDHEVATKGSTKAAEDQAAVFKSQTHDALIKNAAELGLTAKQAQAVADNYFKINNKDVKSTIEAVGLNNINSTLNKIGQLLAHITGQVWTVPIDITITKEVQNIITTTTVARLQKNTTGLDYQGHKIQANGSVLDFYANGGVRENHVAQIASASSMRVWAEPETQGEAYIPLAPAKRARSTDIWRETGRRLGQFADGGGVGGASGSNSSMDDLVSAVYALAQREIVLKSNNVELARAANQGNLTLTRVGS